MPKRVRVLAVGRVQNVGFRIFVARRAASLGLGGWVMNMERHDSLTAEVEGQDDCVDQFVDAVRAGPAASRVEHVTVTMLQVTCDWDGSFIIH